MTDPMQTEREAFEAWGLREGRLPAGHKRITDGRYFYMEVQDDWECWQAAISSRESELRSLRDALALAKSRIAELTEALEMMLEFPKTGPAITAARAALKEPTE